jgi:hypothetical protein
VSGDVIETMAKALTQHDSFERREYGIYQCHACGEVVENPYSHRAEIALSVVRDELADGALRGAVVDALRDTGEDDGPYLPAAAFRALTAVTARFGGATP